MKTVPLPTGEQVPALGAGTWNMGDDPAKRKEEIATLNLALDLGVTLIDTAEMYGDGRSEQLINEAIGKRRDDFFLVTKVYPHNASRDAAIAACERSLARLGTDHIDLYFLHWRGGVPFSETIEAFMALKDAGKIRHFGVSNLDKEDMEEFWTAPGAHVLATNQLLYNLTRRGIEWDLLPWLRERQIPVMAYSPIEQARLTRNKRLNHFAAERDMTAAQLALAWLLAKDDIIAIPMTSRRDHLKENVAALEKSLTAEDLAELDQLFPPPSGPLPLEML